jgi:transposase
LDVHARSVVACGLDGQTGELFERRLCPDRGEIITWIRGLPGPVAVTYEAGPTGFGLARFLTAEGIDCLVAAPSKLQRPSGDRVKTDVRDARHLARLLHLGEIVAVAVPSVEQEAARDLVRAREDVRGDLMSARHRLSKLLLRLGIVYSGGALWTGAHDRWLRDQRRGPVFDTPGLGTAFDVAYDTVLATTARRDRLDAAITADGRRQLLHPGGDPAGLPARGGHVDRVRARRRDRRLAPVDRPLDRRLPRAGAHRIVLRRLA